MQLLVSSAPRSQSRLLVGCLKASIRTGCWVEPQAVGVAGLALEGIVAGLFHSMRSVATFMLSLLLLQPQGRASPGARRVRCKEADDGQKLNIFVYTCCVRADCTPMKFLGLSL